MLAAQAVLGVGCSGMLMCPMTYAAKNLPPQRFGLWGGVIQAFGNTGMLLSASPLALLVDHAGWRAGYVACALLALGAMVAVAAIVRDAQPALQARAVGGGGCARRDRARAVAARSARRW